MSMMTTQTDNTPTVTQNSVSSEKTVDDDIRDLESKAAAEEAGTKKATKVTNALLIVTGAVAVVIALVSLWSSRANSRLRAVENLLNNLRIAKVQADANRQIQVETERVRADAQRDIESARNEARERLETETKRVEGEAGKKIEDAKAEAGVKIEQARAEAAREVGRVQTELARQQERAAKAESSFLELEQAVSPRMLMREDIRTISADLRRFKGIKVKIAALTDSEVMRTARQISQILYEAGWEVVDFESTTEAREYADGVTIYSDIRGTSGDTLRPIHAGLALAAQLNDRRIYSIINPDKQGIPPPGVSVVVRVGLKPPTYFLRGEERDRRREIEEEIRGRLKEADRKSREREMEKERLRRESPPR